MLYTSVLLLTCKMFVRVRLMALRVLPLPLKCGIHFDRFTSSRKLAQYKPPAHGRVLHDLGPHFSSPCDSPQHAR